MIGGALKLARDAWELAGRALGAAGEWLRRPRDWWRVVAFVLALVCVGFAFAVADTKREILLVREQCQTRIITVERQAEKAVAAANTSRAGLQQCKARLEEEVGRAARAAELEREATEAAARVAAQAARDREDWQRTYSERPASCRAALERLEVECPTITDY